MKIRISKKKPVNEFLGGLFSFGSTASKTKPLGSGTANRPMDLNKMFSTLKDLDSQVGKQKLQSLGLSLEDLYNTINNATKIFKSDDKSSTGKGGVQAFGMSKIQNAINLMQQDYQDVIEKVKSKKLTAEEGNKVITGISRIAGFIHDYTPALMEENDDKLNEAFGMQKRAIYKFLQSLKGVDDQGNPVEKIADPSVTAQAAMQAAPPVPPADAGEDDALNTFKKNLDALKDKISAIKYTGQKDANGSNQDEIALFQVLNAAVQKEKNPQQFAKIYQDQVNAIKDVLSGGKLYSLLNIINNGGLRDKVNELANAAKQDKNNQAAQAAMKDEPAKQKQFSPEEMADRVNTYSKMISRDLESKNLKILPDEVKKVINYLMSTDLYKVNLSEMVADPTSDYAYLTKKIADKTGVDKDAVIAIIDSLIAKNKIQTSISTEPKFGSDGKSKKPNTDPESTKSKVAATKTSPAEDVADAFSDNAREEPVKDQEPDEQKRKLELYKRFYEKYLRDQGESGEGFQINSRTKIRVKKDDTISAMSDVFNKELNLLSDFTPKEAKTLFINLLHVDEYLRIVRDMKDQNTKYLVWAKPERFLQLGRKLHDEDTSSNKAEPLKEHLINRKKQEIFTDKDAKRFKLLAGLL